MANNINQTVSGKAFEYGIAIQCAAVMDADLVDSQTMQTARAAYNRFPPEERQRIDRAADEAVTFLYGHDDRLLQATAVRLQPDRAGQNGDVRDIVIATTHGDIGISAKHRHAALKHSRLSGTRDFGQAWYGVPCSNDYWDAVRPIFNELRDRKGAGELWKDLQNKSVNYYAPVLDAFIAEASLYANVNRMMLYLLTGAYDHYKVIKANGDVSLQSFNVHGTLLWGHHVPMPNEIFRLARRAESHNTAIMATDNGWQVSFRIHNASAKVEPSLKFDVTLVGSPQDLARHEIPY